MEGNTTSRPRPNELVIPDDEAYARTDIELSDIAEYLMTNLEPIDIKTLDAEDHICPICHEEFQESDNMKLAYEPVKSVCNHIFGKRCVIKWLDPFFYFGSTGPVGRSSHGKTDCQSCRRNFFPKATLEGMEFLAARLWLWDNAYANAGVARSEIEERSRRYI